VGAPADVTRQRDTLGHWGGRGLRGVYGEGGRVARRVWGAVKPPHARARSVRSCLAFFWASRSFFGGRASHLY